MKRLILLNIVFSAQFVLADSVLKCSPLNELGENIQNVQDVNCEQINKEGQCKEAPPIDANALRNKITRLLDLSVDPVKMESAARNWSNFVKQNPWAPKMYAERSQYEVQEKLPPIPIMDWFSDVKFADGVKSKEEYKKAFIDKYVAFAQKMDCSPTFRASDNYVEPHPTVKGFSAEKMGRDEKEMRLRKLKEEMNDPKNVQAVKDRMKKISDESADRFYICRDKPDLDSNGQVPGRFAVANRFQPCAGNFKKNFANNKYDVSQPELGKLLATPEADELSKCIKERMAQGAKVHHISINASASSLNNTGDAEKRFCKKGFLGLSEARAETAKSKILPGLFEKAGQGGFDLSKAKIEVSAQGANGDGTSGPCVYETKNGKEVLKPYYNTKAGQEELDENRYVNVQVTFEDTTKKINDNIPKYEPMYRCKKIEFKCE
ncbi:MAG: hypothetical protein NDI63_02225 [Pseudobdellovibrio sp.]|nr:hypothetical protein [Pseudobdellovibrio sp.]